MKSILKTSLFIGFVFCNISLHSEDAPSYSYKKRQLNVRTTAYTHSESDHIEYGRKTALGTKLKCTQEYHSAAADWSRFPVGTEFRIVGMNRHFVIDDYGSALLGKDTIDIYFTSKNNMNRWGVQHVDIVITKYGDFDKSREILSQRTKYHHCRTMLAEIKKNAKNVGDKGEVYEPVPDVPAEIDSKLMAAASIPSKEWKLPSPEIQPDPKQPKIEDFMIANNPVPPQELKPIRKLRSFREIFAGKRQPGPGWRMSSRKKTGSFTIPVSMPTPVQEPVQQQAAPTEYQSVRKVRAFRPVQ